jgi:hypothetical protein
MELLLKGDSDSSHSSHSSANIQTRQAAMSSLSTTKKRNPFPDANTTTTTTTETTTTTTTTAAASPTHKPIQVEVFINPASRMLQEIRDHQDPTVQAWRTGKVLVDDAKGTVDGIRQFALEVYSRGKPTAIGTWSMEKMSWVR